MAFPSCHFGGFVIQRHPKLFIETSVRSPYHKTRPRCPLGSLRTVAYARGDLKLLPSGRGRTWVDYLHVRMQHNSIRVRVRNGDAASQPTQMGYPPPSKCVQMGRRTIADTPADPSVPASYVLYKQPSTTKIGSFITCRLLDNHGSGRSNADQIVFVLWCV